MKNEIDLDQIDAYSLEPFKKESSERTKTQEKQLEEAILEYCS